ncbi:MAG: zinc ribbon domain-containing protein [Ardenticatenales bacterium]|nr:zinc ribbon domain-containing protein [Ardenticatenales bacterium]
MAKVTCPVCSATFERPADGICPECGVALTPSAAPVIPPPARATAAKGGSCPVCGAPVKPGAKVCDECGIDLAEAQAAMSGTPSAAGSSVGGTATTHSTCPVCGATVKPGAKVCDDCGVNLAEAQSMTSSGNGAAISTVPSAPPAAAAPAAVCPSCGADRRPGASFCRECGESFPKTPSIQGEGLLEPGEFLSGRYRVERKLGGGGMGAVYLAKDMNLKGKLIAIKAVLNSEDPDLLRAARQEAENLLGIDHPNIVTLRDIVEKASVPFIVMDYLEGPDWNDLYEQRISTKEEAFTAEEAITMILGIVPAFEYLHNRRPPVVYRDFKPSQVKVVTEKATGQQRHVLLDLGVAYTYEGQPEEAWGTVGYAPPEVGGVCLQPPTMDLATICRTLQGLLGLDLMKYGYGNMPPMDQVPWIPEELYYLLERGTALDPRRRFQTLADLRAQMEGVLRLIQGRQGTLPRPSGAFYTPVVSRIFTGNLHRTTGHLLSLPVSREDDPAAPSLDQASDLLLQGKPEDALAHIEQALTINPKSTHAYLLKTVALGKIGQLEQAQVELNKVTKLTDISSDWSYAIVAAQMAEDSNDPARAEQLYRDLLRMVPGELPPRQKLANLLLRQGRYQEASDLYAQIVGADPANAEAILNWADSLAAVGSAEQSISVLRRVGENAVRFVDAQTRMIELLLQRAHQDPAALNLAAEAIESLQGRTQTPRYYRLAGDWWFEAYQLGQRNKLDQIQNWPMGNGRPALKEIAQRAREAYRHYLRVAPSSDDTDEIIGRIHFGIRHMM